MSSTRSLVREIPFCLFVLILAACSGGGGSYGGGGGTPTGGSGSTLSVFAGDPTGAGNTGSNDAQGTAARFKGPAAIATDAVGNIYVADSMNSAVRKITPAGDVSTLAATASFSDLEGIAVDSAGNVFVTDGLDGVIRKVTPAGVVSTF